MRKFFGWFPFSRENFNGNHKILEDDKAFKIYCLINCWASYQKNETLEVGQILTSYVEIGKSAKTDRHKARRIIKKLVAANLIKIINNDQKLILECIQLKKDIEKYFDKTTEDNCMGTTMQPSVRPENDQDFDRPPTNDLPGSSLRAVRVSENSAPVDKPITRPKTRPKTRPENDQDLPGFSLRAARVLENSRPENDQEVLPLEQIEKNLINQSSFLTNQYNNTYIYDHAMSRQDDLIDDGNDLDNNSVKKSNILKFERKNIDKNILNDNIISLLEKCAINKINDLIMIQNFIKKYKYDSKELMEVIKDLYYRNLNGFKAKNPLNYFLACLKNKLPNNENISDDNEAPKIKVKYSQELIHDGMGGYETREQNWKEWIEFCEKIKKETGEYPKTFNPADNPCLKDEL